jgi:hypothetical protein
MATTTKKTLSFPPSIVLTGSIRVPGAVFYERLGEEGSTTEQDDGRKDSERIRTTRKIVTDLEERAAAEKLANALRYQVACLARPTALGPLCPLDEEQQLLAVIDGCIARATEFNATARYHHVVVGLVPVRMEGNDERSSRLLVLQMQELLAELQGAMEQLDAPKIKGALMRIRTVATIFPEQQQQQLIPALVAAQKLAATAKREVGKKGRDIEAVKAEMDLSPIQTARLAFLDLASPQELQAVSNGQGTRAAALEMEAPVPVKASSAVDAKRLAAVE